MLRLVQALNGARGKELWRFPVALGGCGNRVEASLEFPKQCPDGLECVMGGTLAHRYYLKGISVDRGVTLGSRTQL